MNIQKTRLTHPTALAVIGAGALTCDPRPLVSSATQDAVASLQTRPEGANIRLERRMQRVSSISHSLSGLEIFYLQHRIVLFLT